MQPQRSWDTNPTGLRWTYGACKWTWIFLNIPSFRKGLGLADIPLRVFVQCTDSVLFSFNTAESTCMQCWLENFPTRPNHSTLRLCTTKWKKTRWIPFRTTCHPVGWLASLVYVILSSLSLYIIHLNRFLPLAIAPRAAILNTWFVREKWKRSCILAHEALLGGGGVDVEYLTSD